MPKTVPPPIPRKAPNPLKTSDISPTGSDKENTFIAPRSQTNGFGPPTNGDGVVMNGKRNPSNWRKDEKSEKSVRDKIAMFSHSKDEQPILPNKFISSHLAKSTECLDTTDSTAHRRPYDTLSRKYSDSIENGLDMDRQSKFKTMRTRSHSVETLDEVDRGMSNILDMLPPVCPKPVENTKYEAAYRSKFMVEKSKPVPILEKAFSVENVSATQSDIIPPPASYGTLPRKSVNNPPLIRRTSFSGDQNQTEAQRKASVSTLLEQRKKSISKLRGLIIPEKVPETDVLMHHSTVIGNMPMIKSKDCDKINNELMPKMNETKAVPFYARRASVDCVMGVVHSKQFVPTYTKVNSLSYGIQDSDLNKRTIGLGPAPAKPPRMSLQLSHKFTHDLPTKGGTDESEDSDSIISSRRSSPLISPGVTPAPIPDKLPLCRNLSSETNISITSSNSTLTTGSTGSQASCSSAGSTPTIDMSRKIVRQGSNEINRKSVLALSKSRNGTQERKLDAFVPIAKSKRYDEDESTEEEDVKRMSKPLKSRNSLTKESKVIVEKKDYVSYKLASPADVINGMNVNIAQTVEVIDHPDMYSNKPSNNNKKGSGLNLKMTTKTTQEKRSSDEPSPSMSDLAKWVRSEAAKTMPHQGIGTLNKAKVEPEVTYEGTKEENVGDYLKKYSKAEITKDDAAPVVVLKKRESRFGEPKKLNLSEIRRNFENKSASPVKAIPPTTTPAVTISSAPTTTSLNNTNSNMSKEKSGHDRFSSWDSVASSSSGVSSMQTSSLIGNANANSGSSHNLQSPPSEFGSFSSLGSSHSLITPQVSKIYFGCILYELFSFAF